MSHTKFPDPDAVVAHYAPSASSLAAEWDDARMDAVLLSITGAAGAATRDSADTEAEIPLRFVATHADTDRRRWSRGLPVAASVAAVGVVAGLLIGALGSGNSSSDAVGGRTTGSPFTPPAGLSDTSIAKGQYSYRVEKQADLGTDGAPKPNGPDSVLSHNYVSYGGDVTVVRTGGGLGCVPFRRSSDASFEQPAVAFFARMPTDVNALNTYLRGHVQGSSSRDEAVFVAVGDALRAADGLASPKLRAAMLAVLSRTAGVRLHLDERDYLGRPAIRADFVEQRIRPGEVHAYYFDPSTFQLLEDFDGTNNAPSSYDGPSPAYSAHADGTADDPDQLGGPGLVNVMRSETVLDSLPAEAASCTD